MVTRQVFEGTWEELARQTDWLAGKRVRLVVVENVEPGEEKLPFYAGSTPDERARAWDEWCKLPRPHVPPLSDQAISRDRIYSPERD